MAMANSRDSENFFSRIFLGEKCSGENAHGYFTLKTIASLFGPHEFVAIIANISLYRRLFLLRGIHVR